jgi:AcrR family transcriptional regulator
VTGRQEVRADSRGVARREAIIEAATDVFARNGFRTSSLSDVADRAGVTAQGVLYHFGSKEELLLSVIRARDRWKAEIKAEMPPEAGWASIRGIVRFAEIAEAAPNLHALQTVLRIESIDTDSPAHEYFRTRDRLVLENTVACLRVAQGAGEIGPDVDCLRVARQIVAFQHGAAVLWLRNRELSLVELYRDYLSGLERALTCVADEHVVKARSAQA